MGGRKHRHRHDWVTCSQVTTTQAWRSSRLSSASVMHRHPSPRWATSDSTSGKKHRRSCASNMQRTTPTNISQQWVTCGSVPMTHSRRCLSVLTTPTATTRRYSATRSWTTCETCLGYCPSSTSQAISVWRTCVYALRTRCSGSHLTHCVTTTRSVWKRRPRWMPSSTR